MTSGAFLIAYVVSGFALVFFHSLCRWVTVVVIVVVKWFSNNQRGKTLIFLSFKHSGNGFLLATVVF